MTYNIFFKLFGRNAEMKNVDDLVELMKKQMMVSIYAKITLQQDRMLSYLRSTSGLISKEVESHFKHDISNLRHTKVHYNSIGSLVFLKDEEEAAFFFVHL